MQNNVKKYKINISTTDGGFTGNYHEYIKFSSYGYDQGNVKETEYKQRKSFYRSIKNNFFYFSTCFFLFGNKNISNYRNGNC